MHAAGDGAVDHRIVEHLPARHAYPAEELLVWRRRIPNVKLGVVASHASRPNPAVMGDLMVASIFSPGQVRALERSTGEERWHVPLSYFGDSDVEPAGNLLLAGTSKTLLAVEPASGKVIWEFCPYPGAGERIYCAPIVTDERVFTGDREGWLYCLDLESGRRLWSVQTSRAEHRSVNSMPLIDGDRIIVSAFPHFADAYEMASGRRVWRQRLASGSIWPVRRFGETALVQGLRTLYALCLRTGAVLHRWRWPEREIHRVEVAGDILLVVTAALGRLCDVPRGRRPLESLDELAAWRSGQELWRQTYPRYSLVHLRWDPPTRLLHEATSHGVGLLNPQTGERLACIHDFGRLASGAPNSSAGIPTVAEDRLYALTGDGSIWALRLPTDATTC